MEGEDIDTCSKEIPASSQPVNGQCDDSKHYTCLNDTTISSKRIENSFYKWTCLGLHGGSDIFLSISSSTTSCQWRVW